MTRPLRFGLQLTGEHLSGPIAAAQRAEEIGFDVVTLADHVGPGVSPMITLGAIAAATSRIRLGTFVLNNDMRNPVQLAWETATLDRLSKGRFELGLGAGHTPQEYGATGIDFDPAKERKQRLIESVEIIRRLIDGEAIAFDGKHYQLEGASIRAAHQKRLPILIGGNGSALLRFAGAHADIIGFQGLGRTREDGHAHDAKWDPEWLTTQVEQVRAGARDRFDELELNAFVQSVQITHDRYSALAALSDEVEGLSPSDATAIPYVLIGSVDEIVEDLLAYRDRWGISYFVVRELEQFAPVLEAIGGHR